MRPYGVEKGHTNCQRCEKLGAETVVSNLCNYLGAAARKGNPAADIVAWPYSAEHVWSADKGQIGFIEKLKPGTGILTEIEKDEYVQKPEGVNKHLWDYSIDLIGPGKRAKEQIAACEKAGIPIFLKSEPELGFEAPRLPSIPCMDRWADRAEALASCGATGAFVFPAFRPCYGTIAAEVPKLFWWDPAPEKERTLLALAERTAGKEAAPHLRKAWEYVSRAIDFSPELPPYYTGPYYLGPMQPMCCDPEAELPEVFYGYYFFMAEIMDSEGVKKRPTYLSEPRGDVPVFGRYYRRMEEQLAKAVEEIDRAEAKFSGRPRVPFDSEVSAIRFFYRTARTHANFYESCQLRDRVVELSKEGALTPDEKEEFEEKLLRWRKVLLDEKENTEKALPLVEADPRLDPYHGSDHSFSHGADMIRKKLALLDREIGRYLPSLEAAIR
jgi:hypothetical protein